MKRKMLNDPTSPLRTKPGRKKGEFQWGKTSFVLFQYSTIFERIGESLEYHSEERTVEYHELPRLSAYSHGMCQNL